MEVTVRVERPRSSPSRWNTNRELSGTEICCASDELTKTRLTVIRAVHFFNAGALFPGDGNRHYQRTAWAGEMTGDIILLLKYPWFWVPHAQQVGLLLIQQLAQRHLVLPGLTTLLGRDIFSSSRGRSSHLRSCRGLNRLHYVKSLFPFLRHIVKRYCALEI